MSNTPAPPPSLQTEYQKARQHFDLQAHGYKRMYTRAWYAATLSVWLTLLLGIIGLALPEATDFHWFILKIAVPSASVIGITATCWQWCGLRARWRNYRWAAEELGSTCMLFRLRLPPYDSSCKDPENDFRGHIKALSKRAATGQGDHFLERWRWWFFWRLIVLPGHLDEATPHTPDEPDSTYSTNDPDKEEAAVLRGRLVNQQKWHLLKARAFFSQFVAIQAIIILINLGCGTYSLLHGAKLCITTLATAVILMLYTWRDFLDLSPLFQRYVRVAGILENIRAIYNGANDQLPVTNPKERMERIAQTAQRVEEVLRHEYQAWVARVG